jgi:hypothetical protein
MGLWRKVGLLVELSLPGFDCHWWRWQSLPLIPCFLKAGAAWRLEQKLIQKACKKETECRR